MGDNQEANKEVVAKLMAERDEEEARERIDSYTSTRKEAIILIKVIGFFVSVIIAGTLTGIAADTTSTNMHRKQFLGDLGLFFWFWAIFFFLLLRNQVWSIISETAHACSETFTFMKIWKHTVINTVCFTFIIAFLIMSICYADMPKLKTNKVFLAFYGIVGGMMVITFLCGGYHLCCLPGE